MTELEQLREIERQAIAEGCNIGSDEQSPVWLVNQRAEVAEARLATALAELESLHRVTGWQSTADVIAAIKRVLHADALAQISEHGG